MSVKSIKISKELGSKIKERRNEIGLTIEEAAKKAGVGVKTWCRYESGEAIRADKCKGVCKVLGWKSLEMGFMETEFNVSRYYTHEAWSSFLAEEFGEITAASFVIGSDILLDDINEDLRELSALPKGSHLGQLDLSIVVDFLPEQFLMNYDYEFLYNLKSVINNLRSNAKEGKAIVAHTVLQEIALYMIVQEADMIESEHVDPEEYDENWIFDLFDDMDVVTFLYSKIVAVDTTNPYHFVHWNEKQFFE